MTVLIENKHSNIKQMIFSLCLYFTKLPTLYPRALSIYLFIHLVSIFLEIWLSMTMLELWVDYVGIVGWNLHYFKIKKKERNKQTKT